MRKNKEIYKGGRSGEAIEKVGFEQNERRKNEGGLRIINEVS